MASDSSDYPAPGQSARIESDAQLATCRCAAQEYKHAVIAAAQCVAVRKVPTESRRAEYVLLVDWQAVGVIDAKKVGNLPAPSVTAEAALWESEALAGGLTNAGVPADHGYPGGET